MSVTSGPNLPQNGLIFNIDCASDRSFTPGSVLINSVGLSGQSFAGYCGSLSNVTYNTNEVQAPDGTYTATKVARDSSNSCGAGGAYGIFWNNNSTVQAGQTYTNSIYAKAASGNISLIFGISDSSTNTYTIGQNWTKITRTIVAPNSSRGIQALTYDLNYTYYLWSGVLQNVDILKDNVGNISSNIYNGPIFNDGSNANFLFDGVNDYIFASGIMLSTQTTLIAWFKTPNTFSNNYIISLPFTSAGGNGVDLCFAGTSTFRAYVITVNNITVLNHTTNYNDNKWHMGAVTYDGSIATLYYDGVAVTSAVASGILKQTANGELNIGRFGSYGGYILGNIAAIQVYNRSLSASEVQRSFNAFRGRFGI